MKTVNIAIWTFALCGALFGCISILLTFLAGNKLNTSEATSTLVLAIAIGVLPYFVARALIEILNENNKK